MNNPTEMASSSNALDVSLSTPDMKFMMASNVNVSNFVTVKLSGHTNYRVWRAQMICLVESQKLPHILVESVPFPMDKGTHMIMQYDRLVKGWIFSSMNENVLKDLIHLEKASDVWAELESLFYTGSTNGDEWDAPTADLKFMMASTINVSNFVTVKLSGQNNYKIWNAQMKCLVESQMLEHIIFDDNIPFPMDKGIHMIGQYERLVKGWIFSSLSENVLKEVIDLDTGREVWDRLAIRHKPPEYGFVWDVPTADLKYNQISKINVSNFVSIKLSGHSNYDTWKAQMLCLLRRENLDNIIGWDNHGRNADIDLAMNEDMRMQYGKLVKGWIFGSMNEEVLKDFVDFSDDPKEVWETLKSLYAPPNTDTNLKFMFGIESERGVPEIENNVIEKGLYEAAVEGCWWKAKPILKIHNSAATEKITSNGDTMLHLAVERGHNHFVEQLLEFFKVGRDITETKNNQGQTALHIAAMVGNEYAAQLLVQKRNNLLVTLDNRQESPLNTAFLNKKLNVCAYLLKSVLSSDLLNPVDCKQIEESIYAAILTKQYDIAETFVTKFANYDWDFDQILLAITISFPTDLCFMEYFIYPSFHNVRQKLIIMKGYLLCHHNIMDKCMDDILRVVKICNNACFSWLGEFSLILPVLIAILYAIYQCICLLVAVLRLTFSLLYFLLWKTLTIGVPPIKKIEKKKKEYEEARKFLSFICKINQSDRVKCEALIEAVRHGTYEVVDEILFVSPDYITNKDEEGHNIIQLAIMNRSEKVYNLIHHIIERSNSFRRMTDSSLNNLAHLACTLAPSSVLGRTTGAALQMQRELIWREEVEKLMLPQELMEVNIYKETPAMVFTREHQDMMKQGENWMKTTAESCSITAALIITIVFAAAITVPGGSNQESGIPVFKNETAFTVFAFSNAFSLFASTTSLLLFLSILTARYSERDFLVSLPRRLILGLFTLFLSTTAMIVAFGAILFLVFCDQRPWMLAPVCVFACMPISVIVTLKLPLLVDLIQSTYIPIFGKQSYLESCKISRKNTLFK